MIDLCIEKEKMLDFSPTYLESEVSLAKFLQYLHLNRVQVGSFNVREHRQYISPYYSQIRKVVAELQQNNVILVAHPKLSTEAPLELFTEAAKAATLLNLQGLHTYKGVPHFASAATVKFQDSALLDKFFEALVAKAGHSGRKNLI